MDVAVHRAIICVDVEGFGDRRRTNRDQVAVRGALYRTLRTAFTRSEVDWDHCYREDRGDGVLVLVPAEVPKELLVASLPGELAAALARHNEIVGRQRRIRLRAAVHAGEVHYDEHGVAGMAINTAFRLLEVGALKEALRGSPGALALIASQWFYDEVIRHSPRCSPAAYRRVDVAVKEIRAAAWISLPDQPDPSIDVAGLESAHLMPGAAVAAPRQLPAAIGNFVGRTNELDLLTRLLDEPTGRQGAVVLISIVTGSPGVGKTALALHWAHQVRSRFPDGSLYVNLRGHNPGEPMYPELALEGFLRALGVPSEKIPAEMESRAALYRSLLDGRRVLVVLDNASSTEQVRSLLPGAPGCTVVVTSRSSLPGLVAGDGAHPIDLDRLTEAEAITLLQQIIGAGKVDAELAAAVELARRCAYLPLALRIASERAAAHPHRTLADVNSELAQRRLDVLDTNDGHTTAVRTVFSWSYRSLPTDAARAFRLLGLHPGPDISPEAAAALIGASPTRTRQLLEILTRAHLLEENAQDRFRLHDLMRLYADECAHQEETAQQRSDAVRRMLDWYMHTANAARTVLCPYPTLMLPAVEMTCAPLVFTSSRQALHWYETEHLSLIAAPQLAAQSGHHDIAWRLPISLWSFYYLRKRWNDWITTHQIALTSARHIGDRTGEAWVLRSLGYLTCDLHQFQACIDHNQQALAIFCEIGDQWGRASSLHGLGEAYRWFRRFEESIDHEQQALAICRKIGDQTGPGHCLTGLGYCNVGLRRFEEAIGYFRQARTVTPAADWVGEAWALLGLAYAYRGEKEFEQSINHGENALAIFRRNGDWWGQAEALYIMGKSKRDIGHPDAAHQSWNEAMTIFEDLHPTRATEVRILLKSLTTTDAAQPLRNLIRYQLRGKSGRRCR